MPPLADRSVHDLQLTIVTRTATRTLAHTHPSRDLCVQMKGRKSERGMQGLVHSTKGPNEPPSGVYDVFNPGDRVRFYMPAASRGSDGMATGTIVNKIDKPNKTSQALVGQVRLQAVHASHWP